MCDGRCIRKHVIVPSILSLIFQIAKVRVTYWGLPGIDDGGLVLILNENFSDFLDLSSIRMIEVIPMGFDLRREAFE
jgi:hypothetical protein